MAKFEKISDKEFMASLKSVPKEGNKLFFYYQKDSDGRIRAKHLLVSLVRQTGSSERYFVITEYFPESYSGKDWKSRRGCVRGIFLTSTEGRKTPSQGDVEGYEGESIALVELGRITSVVLFPHMTVQHFFPGRQPGRNPLPLLSQEVTPQAEVDTSSEVLSNFFTESKAVTAGLPLLGGDIFG